MAGNPKEARPARRMAYLSLHAITGLALWFVLLLLALCVWGYVAKGAEFKCVAPGNAIVLRCDGAAIYSTDPRVTSGVFTPDVTPAQRAENEAQRAMRALRVPAPAWERWDGALIGEKK